MARSGPRRAARRGPRRGVHGLAIAGLVAALGLILLLPDAGARAQEDHPAEVLIEAVTPAAPRPASTITISGRVANTGEEDVTAPWVQLRFSPLPLNSRSEIPQILAGSSDRTGTPVPGVSMALGERIAPGQQAEFLLRVPVADLGLPLDEAGAYAVFVELLSEDISVSAAGTVFPWFPPRASFRPSEVAFVWPVVQQPAVAADELVVDPAIPGEFTSGGRLSRLLDLGQQHPVSWLVDTATLEAAIDMGDGYQVLTADGPQPGDQTAAATAFAQRLRALLARNTTTTLPQYALADADAFQHANLVPFVVRSATLPQVIRSEVAPSATTGVTYVAAGGAADDDTLQTLIDAGVRRLLLGDQFFPAEPATSYTPSGVTKLTVGGTTVTALLSDRQLARTLRRPLTTAAERSRARQELLTDTAMITLEQPWEPRRVVATPPLLWDPPQPWLTSLLTAVDGAPWMRLIGLDRVAAAKATPRLDTSYGDLARRRELPPQYMTRISDGARELDRLSRVVNDPGGFGEGYRTALQRAGSALWRNLPVERNAFMDVVSRQLADQKDSVRVVSSGVVTLAGDNGTVPLTIANDLDRSVTVGLQLATDNPIRLQYTPPEPVRIDAREKAGVEVPVRVVGSQPMTVRVVLTDNTGGLYDDSATIELRSTAATRIATIVVGVGAVTLVILVGLNLMRRRSGRPGPGTDAEPQLQDEHA